MYDKRENEHQELFHLNVDLTRAIDMHIPSPLGALGYFVYVLVKEQDIPKLSQVSMKFDLVGLHSSRVTVQPRQGVPDIAQVPSSRFKAMTWYCLGRADVARGSGTMEIIGWPGDLNKIDLLLCTWPRFIESGQADDWMMLNADPKTKDPLFAPTGVPLGGIGCGRVDICRDGRFRNFSMNNNQDAPLEDPNGLAGAYLGVAVGGVVKDLASRPIIEGHGAVSKLSFEPRFPRATLRSTDAFDGIDVTATLSGPFTPHDLKRSSLPGFLVRWQVRNRTSTSQAVRVQMGWPNLIGIGGYIAEAEKKIGYGDGYYHHWDDPTGRREEKVAINGFRAIRFTGEPGEAYKASQGEHLLAVQDDRGTESDSACGNGRGEVFWNVDVPAGHIAHVTMAVVCAMPHWVDSLLVDRGMYWQNNFEDAADILNALTDDDGTDDQLAKLIADSTLPDWAKYRLSNCNYPLVTNSVLYRDGRFSINEGPTEMSGTYGTIDQRLGAHPATQIFFPELNATELRSFSKIQGPNGGIQHDLGGGHLERGPGETNWPDLTCSFVIQTARHAWSTGDREFENEIWPIAKRAILRHAQWADAGEGVAQLGGKGGLGTSYDSYHYIGTTAYIGTLWLAALMVAEQWARRAKDDAFIADLHRWQSAAEQRLVKDLWNGQYYIAYASKTGERRETCHAGQIAGQVFSRMLCGRNVLDEPRVKAVSQSLLRLNGGKNFAVPPDEVSSDGGAGADFGWLPYVEAFMLSAVATVLPEQVWPVWERVVKHMDDEMRHPCDTRLMYLPVTGELSWGTYYMTAPASWLVYDGITGFFYSAADRTLRLNLRQPGRYPLVHPLFWAMAEMDENGQISVEIREVFSSKPPVVERIEIGGIQADGGTKQGSQLPEAFTISKGKKLRFSSKA